MAHSVLAIPVAALEPYVRGRWEHYDPRWVSPDPRFTHAHVTALAPFLVDPGPGDLADVADVARTTAAFDFTLARVATFPNGIIHLVPEPATPFAVLTARLWRSFPQCPPYAGEFADVVPHLTLDQVGQDVDEESVRADLAAVLPVRVRAERLELHRYAEGDCRVVAGWDLGAEGPGTEALDESL